jgi:hypothetical protein
MGRKNEAGLPELRREVFEIMAKRYNSTVLYMRQKYYNAKNLEHLKECLALQKVVTEARNKKEKEVLKQLLAEAVKTSTNVALVRETVDELSGAYY